MRHFVSSGERSFPNEAVAKEICVGRGSKFHFWSNFAEEFSFHGSMEQAQVCGHISCPHMKGTFLLNMFLLTLTLIWTAMDLRPWQKKMRAHFARPSSETGPVKASFQCLKNLLVNGFSWRAVAGRNAREGKEQHMVVLHCSLHDLHD